MSEEKLKNGSRWRNIGIGFAIWTIVGASFGTRSYLYAQLYGPPATFREMIPNYMTDFYIWGLFSPVIFWLSKRFPIERNHLGERILLHTVICLVSVLVITSITIPTTWYLGLSNTTNNPTLGILFNKLILNPFMVHQGLLAYCGTLVVAHSYGYYRQVQVARTRTSELSAQLAQAQLAALKMQIHPHFLFNTLNSIAALLHKDVELADRMITRLSDFLRITLQSSDTSVVTLGEELEFLEAYLDIERIRFQDRLVVEITVAPDTLNARVPNLILQPLVENAVRHGISKQVDVGYLSIDARMEEGRLVIMIEDNGPGYLKGSHRRDGGGVEDGGLGIANTKARLRQFYGDFTFDIAGNKGRDGTTVTLSVPFLS